MLTKDDVRIEDFERWLRDLPPDRTFRTCCGGMCPLAEWLKTKDLTVWVTRDAIVFDGGSMPIPQWCRVFVTCFDFGENATLADALDGPWRQKNKSRDETIATLEKVKLKLVA